MHNQNWGCGECICSCLTLFQAKFKVASGTECRSTIRRSYSPKAQWWGCTGYRKGTLLANPKQDLQHQEHTGLLHTLLPPSTVIWGYPLGAQLSRVISQRPRAGNRQIHRRSEAIRAASGGPGKRLCLSHWNDAKGQRVGRGRPSQQGIQEENTAGSCGRETPAKLVPHMPEPPVPTNSSRN